MKLKLFETLALVLIAISCFLLPLITTFSVGNSLFIGFIYLIDFFFIIELAVRYYTSVRRSKHDSGKQHLTSLFVIEVLANIPIIYSNTQEAVVWLQFFPLIRLLRIVRFYTIINNLNILNWNYSGYLRILKFFLTMTVFLHWIACGWIVLAQMNHLAENTWYAIQGLNSSDQLTSYIRSLYWSVITMTTVGYGDITPSTNAEYIYSMVIAILGASSYAFIIGSMASLISNLNITKNTYRNKTESINQYMFERKFPFELTRKIRDYYDYLWLQHKGSSEKSFLADLPVHLKLEVLRFLSKEIVQNVPIFIKASTALSNALLLSFKYQIYPPDCYVTQKGELGEELYFVANGKLKIVSDNQADYGFLVAGDYFGEMSLLLNEKRTASVKTVSYCEIFSIDRDIFNHLKEVFPEFKSLLKELSGNQSQKRTKLIMDEIIL